MGSKDLVNEILALKRERNAVILAHNYMDYDIQVVADFVGDLYDLALRAFETNAEVIVFAEVRFMAEQAKALTTTKSLALDYLASAVDIGGSYMIAGAMLWVSSYLFEQLHRSEGVQKIINTP